MVLEQVIKTKWVKKKPIYSLLLGMFFTILAFFTSYLLFHRVSQFIGIATMLFAVVIGLPSVNKLFSSEEMIEVRGKKQPFLKEHESIIDFFIYFFIGVFLILFIIALIKPEFVFSSSQLYGRPVVEVKAVEGLPPPPPPPISGINIFKNNLYVMVIAFILSLFYGSGALFLITLNASIFASALASVIRSKAFYLGTALPYAVCNLGIMFFHMIPEISGYLLAAIAGGVLSKAFIREKFWSENFKKVLKDAVILLISAFVVLVIATIIEINISKKLFSANVCVDYSYLIIIISLLIIGAIVLFEYLRKRLKK